MYAAYVSQSALDPDKCFRLLREHPTDAQRPITPKNSRTLAYDLETSVRGSFAGGDVRHNSVKAPRSSFRKAIHRRWLYFSFDIVGGQATTSFVSATARQADIRT
jgi:thioredoxin reductase